MAQHEESGPLLECWTCAQEGRTVVLADEREYLEHMESYRGWHPGRDPKRTAAAARAMRRTTPEPDRPGHWYRSLCDCTNCVQIRTTYKEQTGRSGT